MTESNLKKFIKQELTKLGEDCWWFMPPANGFGRSGIPDFVGCYKGAFFAIEAKASDGVVSAFQQREGAAILKSGGKFRVSFDKDNVETFIESLKEL